MLKLFFTLRKWKWKWNKYIFFVFIYRQIFSISNRCCGWPKREIKNNRIVHDQTDWKEIIPHFAYFILNFNKKKEVFFFLHFNSSKEKNILRNKKSWNIIYFHWQYKQISSELLAIIITACWCCHKMKKKNVFICTY